MSEERDSQQNSSVCPGSSCARYAEVELSLVEDDDALSFVEVVLAVVVELSLDPLPSLFAVDLVSSPLSLLLAPLFP